MLHNDDELKERYHLPKTNIRTDSYVAVQLLEQDGRLDAETIGNAASLLEGTFSLSVLDQFNNLYLIKGNSPLCKMCIRDRRQVDPLSSCIAQRLPGHPAG